MKDTYESKLPLELKQLLTSAKKHNLLTQAVDFGNEIHFRNIICSPTVKETGDCVNVDLDVMLFDVTSDRVCKFLVSDLDTSIACEINNLIGNVDTEGYRENRNALIIALSIAMYSKDWNLNVICGLMVLTDDENWYFHPDAVDGYLLSNPTMNKELLLGNISDELVSELQEVLVDKIGTIQQLASVVSRHLNTMGKIIEPSVKFINVADDKKPILH